VDVLNRLGVLCLVLGISANAFAGRLWLENGDRIEGEITQLKDGKVEWVTKHLGTVSVPLAAVRGMSLDQLYNVKMGDGGLLPLKDCSFAYAPGRGQWLHCSDSSTMINDMGRLVAISKKPLDIPVLAHRGNVDAAYNNSNGNTNSSTFHIGADAELRHEKMRHRLKASYDREKLNDVISKDHEQLRYSLDYFISPDWFANGIASYERNTVKDLNSRITLGVGGGHQFFETETRALSANAGLAYVQEDNITAADKNYTAMRWSTDFRMKTGYWNSELVHKNELLLPVDKMSEWILQTETGLRAPIWGRINGLLMLEYDFDNDPPEGKTSSDRKLTFGVNYNW
jgi:putative salt-induced outer membrane protein YdiY